MLRIAGIVLAATGAAHLAAPQLFETIAKTAFPENTREWTYRNGAIEIGLGLALTSGKTRILGLVGSGAYAFWLIERVRANRPES